MLCLIAIPTEETVPSLIATKIDPICTGVMSHVPYEIEVADRQALLVVDRDRIDETIRRILHDERIPSAVISLAFVDDAEIHRVNRDHLGHDYPTDVISFLLESDLPAQEVGVDPASGRGHLEGELIVSTETALREAASQGWEPGDELLLYVVHGLLHLCGYDDLTDEARPVMRDRERRALLAWNLVPAGLET